jgi:beta-lactamase regulating signal transducer with metallopeptidase domain
MDAVLNWLWQGGVVAVASFVMLLAMERTRANARYIVCWAAALFVTMLPALPQLRSAAVSPDAFRVAPVDPFVSLPDVWWTSTFVILAAWTLWVSVQIVRFVSAVVAIRRARARTRAFPSDVESMMPHWRRVRSDGRRATLVLSDSVATAAVLGWGAPMIAVAPSLVTTLDADELDRVLIHEWAHVQRRDDLVNILQIVVRIIAGWHPALWWIDRRLHLEREIACDEMTVAAAGSPKSYAACLMKLATVRETRRSLRTAPAVLTASGLRARVVKIVSPHRSIAPAWSRSIAAAIVTALCLMSVGLGELKLVEATAFALPLVSHGRLSTSPDRLSMGTTALSSGIEREGLPRQTAGRPPRAQRPKGKQPSPSPKSETEPNAPSTTDAANAVDSTPAAEREPEHTVAPQQAEVAQPPSVGSAGKAEPQPPSAGSAVTAEPQSPWTAAAAGGAAIGRKSKDAGVATAGFFTRVARRVAGSF